MILCQEVLLTLLTATPAPYWTRYMLIIYYMLPILICTIPIIGVKNFIGA